MGWIQSDSDVCGLFLSAPSSLGVTEVNAPSPGPTRRRYRVKRRTGPALSLNCPFRPLSPGGLRADLTPFKGRSTTFLEGVMLPNRSGYSDPSLVIDMWRTRAQRLATIEALGLE